MKCKYCDTDGLAWPENWVKGMKPIESETGRIHDKDRCMSFQSKNMNRSKGWIDKKCEKCCIVIHYSRKHYTIRTIPKICRDCNMDMFNKLDEYGIGI